MINLRLLQDYGPIKAGQVERFADRIAERLLKEGIAEKALAGPPKDRQAKGYVKK